MFAVCSILECSTTDYIKESAPYLIATLLFIPILVIFPQISLFLLSSRRGAYAPRPLTPPYFTFGQFEVVHPPTKGQTGCEGAFLNTLGFQNTFVLFWYFRHFTEDPAWGIMPHKHPFLERIPCI
jgi:hypothetical protein